MGHMVLIAGDRKGTVQRYRNATLGRCSICPPANRAGVLILEIHETGPAAATSYNHLVLSVIEYTARRAKHHRKLRRTPLRIDLNEL